MPRIEDQIRTEQNSSRIERLCAALQMPNSRNTVLFMGWTEAGLPIMSQDPKSLSTQAWESFRVVKAADYRLDWRIAQIPFVPVEYVLTTKPFDIDDKPGHLSQDTLNYTAIDGNGNEIPLQFEELSLLRAIIENTVKWQDLNTQTIFAGDTIPTVPMYTVLVPSTLMSDRSEYERQVTFAILFRPPKPNESNSYGYQDFLAQTYLSLLKMDSTKDERNKKGYELAATMIHNAWSAEKDELQEQRGRLDEQGSDAFYFMNLLRSLGAPGISDKDLTEIKKDTAGANLAYQVLYTMNKIGVKIPGMCGPREPSPQAIIEEASLKELQTIFAQAYQIASRRIG